MIRNQYRTDSATPRSTQDARAEMIRAMKAPSTPLSTTGNRTDAAPAQPTPSCRARDSRTEMIESLKSLARPTY